MPGITFRSTREPLLRTQFLSHGTLEVRDLQASRRFYEEVLGIEVVQPAPIAIYLRLGGNHTYVAVETPAAHSDMPLLSHNGIDLGSEEEVRRAHERISVITDEYGIRKLTKPVLQHGTYSFYLQDLDGNWWEICHLPPGGYAFRFTDDGEDLTGRTDLTPDELQAVFQRPRHSEAEQR